MSRTHDIKTKRINEMRIHIKKTGVIRENPSKGVTKD